MLSIFFLLDCLVFDHAFNLLEFFKVIVLENIIPKLVGDLYHIVELEGVIFLLRENMVTDTPVRTVIVLTLLLCIRLVLKVKDSSFNLREEPMNE